MKPKQTKEQLRIETQINQAQARAFNKKYGIDADIERAMNEVVEEYTRKLNDPQHAIDAMTKLIDNAHKSPDDNYKALKAGSKLQRETIPDKDHISVMLGDRKVEIKKCSLFNNTLSVMVDRVPIIDQSTETGIITIYHNGQWHKIADSDTELDHTNEDSVGSCYLTSKNGVDWEMANCFFIGNTIIFNVSEDGLAFSEEILDRIKQHAGPVLAIPTPDKNGWMDIESVPRSCKVKRTFVLVWDDRACEMDGCSFMEGEEITSCYTHWHEYPNLKPPEGM